MESDGHRMCSEKKPKVGVGKKKLTGRSLYDAEYDDGSVLNVITQNPTCPATHPLKFHIIQLEIPPFAFFFVLPEKKISRSK